MSNEGNDDCVESPPDFSQIPLDLDYLNSCFDILYGFDGNDDAFVNSDCSPGAGSSIPEAQKKDHNQQNPKGQKPSASRQNQNQKLHTSNPCYKMSNENNDVSPTVPEEPQLEHDKTEQITCLESSTSEPQETDHNESESNEARPMQRRGKMKRKQQDDAKAKRTKRQKPSASGQPPEPKNEDFEKIIEGKTKDFQKIIEEKSVLDGIKYVSDPFNRRKTANKLADFDEILHSMQIEWPMWPEVKRIYEKIDDIKSDYEKATDKGSRITTKEEADFKKRLLEVRVDLEKLKIQEREFSTKERNLEAIFANNEKLSKETLREKFYAAFPCLVLGEIASTGPTAAVKDQGRLQNREQLQASFSSLKNEVYAPDNNKVKVSNFQGLKEALKKTIGWKIPDYLKPIATKIEKDVSEDIEFSCNYLLVCAAIKEMEDAEVENLNPVMLKKWGATLNKAKQQGFQVKYADGLLSKNLHAYFGRSNVE